MDGDHAGRGAASIESPLRSAQDFDPVDVIAAADAAVDIVHINGCRRRGGSDAASGAAVRLHAADGQARGRIVGAAALGRAHTGGGAADHARHVLEDILQLVAALGEHLIAGADTDRGGRLLGRADCAPL